MSPTIRIIVIGLGVACFVLSSFLLKKKHPFWILGLVILNAGLFNLYFSIGQYFPKPFDYFFYPYSSLIITIGIYVFFKNLQTKSISKKDRNLLLLTLIEPILVTTLLIGKLIDPELSSWIWNPINELSQIIHPDSFGKQAIVWRFRFIFFYLFALSFFVILFKLRKVLREAEERHLSFFCSDSFSYYKWIRRVLMVFSIGCFYAVALVITSVFLPLSANIRSTLYLTMGIFGLGLFGLGIFTPLKFGKEKDFKSFLDLIEKSNNSISIETSNKELNKPKPVRSASNAQIEKYKGQLTQLLRDEQIYQDTTLSLASLAEMIGTSTRTLSRVMNEGFDKKFFDLVNSYRIEEVKKYLLDESFSHYSILSIGLEAGFKSKSTFYDAFKKHVGMTPSQYRKQNH